jgi:hypothetical protein
VFGVGCETRPAGLSQQAGEAGGSLTLEVQGRAGSSLDNAGTVRNRQTVRVRQARREGVTRVNQWQNPLKYGTGSNLTDVGRAAVRANLIDGKATRRADTYAVREATVKACGVAVARLQGQSWAPPSTTGTW